EVLELYASGEPAKRVARLPGISQETVNDYLGRIRVKYQNAGRPAPTKTDLFRRAQEDGYLPGPSDPRLGEG
ncbi:MAG: helix-turn-helix transcriptional regulator, partial [Corynebacterium sp.]|nr:helix-turn-helix transcriptional regulator [Corynebacterium sp.]